MKNERNMFGILKKILGKHEIDALAETLIITTETGYELFGEYTITPKKEKFVVNRHTVFLNKEFFSLRNAVVWATLDKRNQIANANRVVNLDILLEGAAASMDLHRTLSEKSTNLDTKSIHITKLNEAQLKHQSLQEEISSYVRETKRWQNQKFKQAIK